MLSFNAHFLWNDVLEKQFHISIDVKTSFKIEMFGSSIIISFTYCKNSNRW